MLPLCPSFFGSWMGVESAGGSSASRGSKKAGSGSYSTRMASQALIAVSSSTAATAATASPMKRTRSTARAVSSRVQGMMQYSVGRSFPVITAYTPSIASASPVSMERIRACAWGERRIFPCSIPGRARSSVYAARPVALAAALTRVRRWPMRVNSRAIAASSCSSDQAERAWRGRRSSGRMGASGARDGAVVSGRMMGEAAGWRQTSRSPAARCRWHACNCIYHQWAARSGEARYLRDSCYLAPSLRPHRRIHCHRGGDRRGHFSRFLTPWR